MSSDQFAPQVCVAVQTRDRGAEYHSALVRLHTNVRRRQGKDAEQCVRAFVTRRRAGGEGNDGGCPGRGVARRFFRTPSLHAYAGPTTLDSIAGAGGGRELL
eukprot:3002644-Pleurochrysis_carterae.AAC.1